MEKTILLIDDEPHLVRMIESRLKSHGYKVITAMSGEEGLGKIQKNYPDLIFLDISMPGMSGLEVLTRLKKSSDTMNIPVIMLTAHSGTEEMLRAEELGSADYVIKPFEASDLMNIVEKYIR